MSFIVLTLFIETVVAHIFSMEVNLLMVPQLSTASLDAPLSAASPASLQRPLINCHLFLDFLECEPVSNPDCELTDSVLISNVCVFVALLLQRRGSACLLVLVEVQPWEASTQGGCDYVTVDCGCHTPGISDKYKLVKFHATKTLSILQHSVSLKKEWMHHSHIW